MALRTRGEKLEEQASEVGAGEPAEQQARERVIVVFDKWGARTVRAVWGEEKITPVPGSYSTLTVGPFEVMFTLLEGEELGPRLEVANRELAEVAEAERERKVESFIAKLKQVSQRARGER